MYATRVVMHPQTCGQAATLVGSSSTSRLNAATHVLSLISPTWSGGCGLARHHWPLVESKTPESPLASIYREIEQALAARLYYLAIASTVSLPDICATLEGKSPVYWKTYKTWFQDNASPYFRHFGADECYELRCGVVHNARFMGGKEKLSRFRKIIFTPPEAKVRIHDAPSTINGETILNMDAGMFCNSMIDAARRWEMSNIGNSIVAENMEHVVRLRPNGLSPHVVGIPVIA